LRAASIKRFFSYCLVAAFGLLSLYAYLTLPSAASPLDLAEHVFFLDAGMGAVIGLLYSLARRVDFFKLSSGRALAFDLRIPVAVVSGSAAAALFYVYRAVGYPLFIAPVPALLVFTVLALRGVYPLRGTTTTFAPLTEDRMVKIITRRDRLKRLAEYRATRFSLLLSKSGGIGNPYVLAARSTFQAIMAAAVAIPVAAALVLLTSLFSGPVVAALPFPRAVTLGLLVGVPLVLTALVPVLLYVYPELKLGDGINQRKEGVERELPFFSILVNVLGSAGMPLYEIFTGIINTKIFSAIRKEALLIKRDVTVFGTDPNDSFERLASYHPSKKFSTLLYGYTAKVRSGGDIPSYLTGESGSLLRGLEESWTMYAGRAGIVGSMMITVFGVIPLLLLVVGIFSPATSVAGLTGFTAVGVPTFTILLVFMAGRMQPVGEEPLTGAPWRSLLLSLPGLGLGLLAGEPWLGAASMLFLFFTVYGYSVMEQRREMKEIDEALPEFMKDVMEFKRQEYDLSRAIFAIAAHNRYTPSFDRLLSRIAAQLKTGTPLDEMNVDARTRLGRMTLFILGQMGRSGGGTVDTVYQLTAYTTKVVEMKKSTQAEMRPYVMLSYISPLLLAFGVTFVGGVLSSFSSRVQPGLSAVNLSGLSIGTLPPQLFQVSDLLIVVSAAALGIIGAKMTDFTVKNTLRASVNVVIAVVATYALSALNLASLFHIGV
jgi:flagellar protein FlaJ